MSIEPLREKLRALIASQSVAASEKLIRNDMADDELKRIAQADDLLKRMPQSNRGSIYAAVIVGVICLTVACFLWTFRLPVSQIQLDIGSENVTIRLAKQANWSGNWDIGSGLLRLESMSRIEVPPELSIENMLAGRSWLESRGGDFELKQFEAKAGGNLLFKKGELHTFDIHSWNSQLLGQLQVSGSPKLEAGQSPEVSEKLSEARFDIPGTITFFHDVAQVPAILHLAPRGSLTLSDLSVDEISFARPRPESETSFQSGISGGHLTILATGEKVPSLEAGARLRMEGVKGVIASLTVSGDGVHLLFEGRVKSITLGPPGFERELKPSWLEYLYHQQRIGFFWTVASFLWGLLWSARTLIFR